MRHGMGLEHGLAHADTDVLVSALIVGQHREASTLVQGWIEHGRSYDAICSEGIQPALVRIGELWAQGRVSVAQEHLATAIAQRILVQAFDSATFAPPNGQKALFACVEGNHHALGLRMVSDTFAIAGWNVAYLGADVPTGDLAQQVDAWRPHLLGLSVSMTEQIPVANDVARRVRDELGDVAPRIVVGGRPLREGSPLPVPLDVDVWTANAGSAAAAL